jgi:hypothetical protein
MTVCGQPTLRVAILALACSIGGALTSQSNAYPADRSVGQDPSRARDTNSKHKYTPLLTWNACGGIPYSGWEGRLNQEGQAWKCDDGATVYFVTDGFTSDRAAETERKARLAEQGLEGKPWRIARTDTLGDAVIVEFAKPVSVGVEEDASNHWMIMSAHDKSILSIYGPDREHVIDFYETRYRGESKK